MDEATVRIIGLHRAEFEQAKITERRAWIAEGMVTVVALVSVLVDVELIAYSAAVVALVAATLKSVFSYQTRRHKSIAERARRVLLLTEGLGYRLSPKEAADLVAAFSVSQSEGRKWEDNEYYQTSVQPSPKKLCLILQESAFLSKHLFAISARRSWLYSLLILSLSAFALFALAGITNQTWSLAIARIVSTVLMFLITIDLLGRAVRYSEAARSVGRIDDRLEGLKQSGLSEQELMLLFGDYNAAVQGAPLIPTSVYDQHRDGLNKLLKTRLDS